MLLTQEFISPGKISIFFWGKVVYSVELASPNVQSKPSTEELMLQTVVLEKTLESPLDCKEIKLVGPQGNQPWTFIGRIDAEAPIVWPPDVKSWLIRKDPDAGDDWGQEEKAATEDEMVGWHHRLNGHESEQAPGDGEGRKPGKMPPSGHKE